MLRLAVADSGARLLVLLACFARRLSSSALASPQQGFGTCRLLGFVLASCRGTDAACRDSDVPHLALEQTLLGDKVGRWHRCAVCLCSAGGALPPLCNRCAEGPRLMGVS